MIASGSQFKCLQGPVQEWGQYPDLVDKRAASTVAVAQQVWFPSFSFTSGVSSPDLCQAAQLSPLAPETSAFGVPRGTVPVV